ncbi:hypothetical protein ZYGR_0H04810 [Zygosaccharomyces rouxii]|uniref:ZYRO0B15070p n=2 Tax=Zygosaccharomyces rouxii TaxID=4956 RepID=C5DSA0_ZYGRC|nr:uncharacterized protein ZYRO0B15070g [Zygosaccharomyces rouxii]KAH9199810.1 hypothetical protein LQ764DRAFT_108101 [Zygosaccharomyces rouxii]GAV47635.1 hypothetical protein ZYGR_0H04810 [Zygosaccharomyces rouxii]CAR26661.1 ZYRO0B15070p [Zygosaccharomyces rouxii]
MEIVSERTIEQDSGQPLIVVIEIRFEYNKNDIVLELVHLLEFLSEFYTSSDNVMIDLQVASTESFHSWSWEKALYIARRSTNFPVPVFLTQTTGVKVNYLKSNRSLKNFRETVRNASISLDDSDNYNDGCDYETTLKVTLLHFVQLNGVDEIFLEQMLQNYHCLEEVLTTTEE